MGVKFFDWKASLFPMYTLRLFNQWKLPSWNEQHYFQLRCRKSENSDGLNYDVELIHGIQNQRLELCGFSVYEGKIILKKYQPFWIDLIDM